MVRRQPGQWWLGRSGYLERDELAGLKALQCDCVSKDIKSAQVGLCVRERARPAVRAHGHWPHVSMPLTYSIATGIGLGFITYALCKIVSGRMAQASFAVIVLAVLFGTQFAIAG